MTRDQQFAYLDLARKQLISWSCKQNVPLHRIEYVVGFGDDFSLATWLFFETDKQRDMADTANWPTELATLFIETLRSAGYAEEWVSKIRFLHDSHENVLRNYKGSYFYFLR